MTREPAFDPEAERARAAALLDEINHPTIPNAPARRGRPKMPPITDTASRLLARRIEAGRIAGGWSRETFAARLVTINAPTLGRIERCERAVSIPELGEFSTALDIPIADLIATGDICPACGQEIPK